ncbi:ABC transporter ATP-binding protein [Prosthecomicrobium hirschii]|uniref:ABC transporter ATP-binding protein n=1 Tax=Prosthecodimorpha hirschii TaxID=665126 RepID=UPI00221FC0B7|nr:ABC transporter ATP-binding protein [Prosthecomicrobium hirschii]MCW1843275.1 ABC transporter ATP-binding protein [Prosthecomicrobium hirschii]
MEAQPVIAVEHLTKTYSGGDEVVHALDDVSFTVPRGSFVAVMGPSGSGKSTLMNLIGCLDRATSGRLLIDGVDVEQIDSDGLAGTRRDTLGFVFQTFNLLPRLTALDNVAMPLAYGRMPRRRRRQRAAELLAAVGLSGRARHMPPQLSGGQKQRVAIARALVNDPAVVLADEPTGALDTRTGREILALLQALNRDGRTILMVTHDEDVARHAGRILRFRDGRLIADEVVAAPLDARAGIEPAPVPAGMPGPASMPGPAGTPGTAAKPVPQGIPGAVA